MASNPPFHTYSTPQYAFGSSTMASTYERCAELHLQDQLKSQILAQARAIWGPKHPGGNFDVITTQLVTHGEKLHIARVIVYTVPNAYAVWKPVYQTKLKKGITEALERLLECLQECMVTTIARHDTRSIDQET